MLTADGVHEAGRRWR